MIGYAAQLLMTHWIVGEALARKTDNLNIARMSAQPLYDQVLFMPLFVLENIVIELIAALPAERI